MVTCHPSISEIPDMTLPDYTAGPCSAIVQRPLPVAPRIPRPGARHTRRQYAGAMTIPEATALIERLEKYPGPESTYRPALETLIADLMEQIFRSADPR